MFLLSDCKFPKQFFRISLPDASYVVASREHLKELFSAPGDALSLAHSLEERMQLRYTFHESVIMNQYHVNITRKELARRLPDRMSVIVDELEEALNDEIPATPGNGMTTLLKLT